MALYYDMMFNTEGVSTAIADLNKGTTGAAGDYNAQKSGQLLTVIVFVAYTAATSLVEVGRVELKCTLWNPNLILFPFEGHGLHTAPGQGGDSNVYKWPVDQAVKSETPIKGQYIFIDTPTTPRLEVYGAFNS